MRKTFMVAMLLATGMSFAGPVMAADGEAIYKAKCIACHGADGKGSAMGPAFKGSAFIASNSDQAIVDVILKGRDGAAKMYKNIPLGMQAQKFSDEEVGAVVAYLKALAAK